MVDTGNLSKQILYDCRFPSLIILSHGRCVQDLEHVAGVTLVSLKCQSNLPLRSSTGHLLQRVLGHLKTAQAASHVSTGNQGPESVSLKPTPRCLQSWIIGSNVHSRISAKTSIDYGLPCTISVGCQFSRRVFPLYSGEESSQQYCSLLMKSCLWDTEDNEALLNRTKEKVTKKVPPVHLSHI